MRRCAIPARHVNAERSAGEEKSSARIVCTEHRVNRFFYFPRESETPVVSHGLLKETAKRKGRVVKALRGTAIHELEVRCFFFFVCLLCVLFQTLARCPRLAARDPPAPQACCCRRRRQAGRQAAGRQVHQLLPGHLIHLGPFYAVLSTPLIVFESPLEITKAQFLPLNSRR